MGRKFKQKASYLADARYLIRLQQSIEEDTRFDEQWKREQTAHLTSLIAAFTADAQALATEDLKTTT